MDLDFKARLKFDKYGNKISNAVGEKGHGTKIFFNSREIKLITIKDGKKINAILSNPIQQLRSQTPLLPAVEYEVNDKISTKWYNNKDFWL